jgi:hypothetical protein
MTDEQSQKLWYPITVPIAPGSQSTEKEHGEEACAWGEGCEKDCILRKENRNFPCFE